MSLHVCILSVQCVLCSYSIQIGQKTAAVLGSHLTYEGHVSAFDFPKHGHDFTWGTVYFGGRKHKWRVCRSLRCPTCQKSPEAFAFHVDCFKILRIGRPKTTFEDIWYIGAWSSPFPGAHYEAPALWTFPELMVNTGNWDPANDYLRLLWRVLKFIPELRGMIMKYSCDSPVWRYAVVLGWRPEVLDKIQSRATQTLLPEDLNNWTRKELCYGENSGKNTQLKTASENHCVVRIGLDRLGIKSIRLLADRFSVLDDEVLGFPWYIIEDIRCLDNFKIVSNDTFIRLIPLQRLQKNLSLWNTPNPADPAQCRIIDQNEVWPQRFRCISFDKNVLGLHVLATGRQIYGIYPHIYKDPLTVNAYRKVPPRQKQGMVWIYFPLAAQEAIRHAWVRQTTGFGRMAAPTLMISTTCEREYMFGQYINPNNENYALCLLSGSCITSLIVNDPNPEDPVLYFGVYCTTTENESKPRPMNQFQHADEILDNTFYYSHASLEGVQQVHIFFGESGEDEGGTDTLLEHCIGMLLEYTNGGQEALGQCRLGYSSSIRTESPIEMHWKKVSLSGDTFGVNIRFSTVDVEFETYNKPGWQSGEMSGTVTWWFNDSTNHIIFGDGRDE